MDEEKPVRDRRKRKQELIVKLFVFDLDSNKQIREHRINLKTQEGKNFVMNAMYWALQNKKTIEIVNWNDDKEDL